MKVFTPEISWHQKEPVFSVDFCKSTWRLASGGADFTVKIWHVKEDSQGNIGLDFMANLDRHSKPVNVVRFSPDGKFLASAGDDCIIIIWKLAEDGEQKTSDTMIGSEEICNKETWPVHKMLRRGHLEDIYDLAWSPDGQQLISGSVDNSAIIWDINKGHFTNIIKDHKHYVQGVCWDPRGQYVATHSSDRSCKIYSLAKKRCIKSIDRATFHLENSAEDEPKSRTCKIFMDETMQSFFRRCTFSPDGLLLVLPGGLTHVEEKPKKATYVFTRGSFNKPALCLPGPKKATVGACFCPIAFENMNDSSSKENCLPESQGIFKLPYRLCYAVATLDSVVFYDTQHHYPFGYVSGVHYASLTDMTWSSDGRVLVVSSLDGYCSFITFKDGELGKPIDFDPMEFVKSKIKARKEAKKEAKKDQPTERILASPVATVHDKEPVATSVQPPCPSKDQSTLDKFMTPVRKRKRNETASTSPNTPSSFKGNGSSGSPYDLTATGEEPMKVVQFQSRESPQSAAPVTKPAVQSPSEPPRAAGLFKHGFEPKPKTPKTSTEKGMTLVPSETSPAARPKIDAPQPRRVSFTTLSSNSKGTTLSNAVDTNTGISSQPQSKQVVTEPLKPQSANVTAKAPRRIQLTTLSVKRDHSGETKATGPNDLPSAPLAVPMEMSSITAVGPTSSKSTALSSAVDTSANASSTCQLKQVASESSKTQSTESTAKAPRRAQLISLSVKRGHSGETKANGSNDSTNTSLPVPMETSLINAPVTGSAGSTPPKGSPKQGRRVNFVTLSSPKFVKETVIEPEIGENVPENGPKAPLEQIATSGSCHKQPEKVNPEQDSQKKDLGAIPTPIEKCDVNKPSGKVCPIEESSKTARLQEGKESNEARKDIPSTADGNASRIGEPSVCKPSLSSTKLDQSNLDNAYALDAKKSEPKTVGAIENQSEKKEPLGEKPADGKTDGEKKKNAGYRLLHCHK